MNRGEPLEIILLAEDESVADSLEALSDDAFARESAGFDGVDTIIVAFSSLSARLIASITKIVIEQIRAHKHIKVRHGETVIEGMSEGKVVELLERLAHHDEK